jgi:hypothetical protein
MLVTRLNLYAHRAPSHNLSIYTALKRPILFTPIQTRFVHASNKDVNKSNKTNILNIMTKTIIYSTYIVIGIPCGILMVRVLYETLKIILLFVCICIYALCYFWKNVYNRTKKYLNPDREY